MFGKIIHCLLLVICLGLVPLEYCKAEDSVKQVICIGDDITKGVWREEMIGNGTRWVDLLASYDKNIEVVNAGENGLLAGNVRYLSGVLEQYPAADMYIIYLGINDLLKIEQVDSAAVASIGAKILRMVRTIKSVNPEADITIVAPQRINYDTASEEELAEGVREYSPVLSDMLDGSLEVVAEHEKVRLVELIDKITPDMLADGVKPNKKGHEKIAALIWKEITEPYINSDKDKNMVVMAPPPVGLPVVNPAGTEKVVAGISQDNSELQGVGSQVSLHENTGCLSLRAKNYVDKQLVQGVVTKEAYRLGKGVVTSIIASLESILVHNVDHLMNIELKQNAGGMISEENMGSEIVYNVPEKSRVESFITTVKAGDGIYETLADAVDWSKIKLETDAEIEKNATYVKNTKSEVIDSQPEIVESSKIDIKEVAERDIIDNNEIINIWLPELDLAYAEVEQNELQKAEALDNIEKESVKLAKSEVKEVFAVADPIEYTGYEVMVHTGISE